MPHLPFVSPITVDNSSKELPTIEPDPAAISTRSEYIADTSELQSFDVDARSLISDAG